jgi:transaldolase
MKFFLDTANLKEIQAGVELGVVDGVTTNPTYIAKEGRPTEEQIRAICDLVDGDISAEVVATGVKEMIREGRSLSAIHPNVVVKCPLPRALLRRHPRQCHPVLYPHAGPGGGQGRRLHHQPLRRPTR